MQFSFESLVAYLGVLIVSFYFASLYEKSKKKLYLILTYCTLVFFSGLRFFVGNDYFGYVTQFYLIKTYEENVVFLEPGYYWLNLLFSFSPIGYWYVFFIATAISYFFILKQLCYENILKWGVFFLVTLGCLIWMNDIIRQGIAFSIFIYALRYMEKGNFYKYFACISIAFLFHYSAVVLLLFYLFRSWRLNSTVWIFLILLTFALQYVGFFRIVLQYFTAFIPYYGRYISKIDQYFSQGNVIGMGLLYKQLLALSVAVFYRKIDNKFYATLFLFGCILDNVFAGTFIFERISNYLVYTNIIIFPHLYKSVRLPNVKSMLVLIILVYFLIQSFTGLEKHGAVPYRTIINKDLENPDYRKYED